MRAVTSSLLDAAFTSFDTVFQQNFQAAKPMAPMLAQQMPSTTKSQRHAWLDRIPGLRKWVGERVVNNLSARTIEVVNGKFEDTISIEREEFEDDQYGVYTPAVGMLGYQSGMWPDDMLLECIQAAKDTTTFDGQNFFDADHPIDPDDDTSDVQSNNFGLALSAENYQTVRAKMQSYKGRDGKPLGVTPTHLVVPPALEKTARTILNAEIIATQIGDAAAAQTNVLKGTADVMVWPRLAGEDDTWYLLDLSKPVKPFVIQLRAAPEFQFLNRPTDPNVFMRDEYLFGVRARGAAFGSLFQFAARSKP